MIVIADGELHAPLLIDYEVVSALRRHAVAGRLDDLALADAIDDVEVRVVSTDRSAPSPQIANATSAGTWLDLTGGGARRLSAA